MRQKLFLLLIVIVFVGCSSIFSPFRKTSNDPGGEYYLGAAIKASYAYQVYVTQYQDERAKIQYLLNLMRYSGAIFIRNNEAFSGRKAARWLEFKLYQFPKEAKTAKAFIENLASHSKKSGKPYQVIFADNSHFPLEVILKNELIRLEKYELRKDNKNQGVVQTEDANSMQLQENNTASKAQKSLKISNPIQTPSSVVPSESSPPYTPA